MTEYVRKKVYEEITDQELEELESYSKDYMEFLSIGKTERLAFDEILRQAEEKGFRDFEKVDSLKPGDKVYAKNNGKAIALFVLGEDITQGMDIVGAHIDSPRLDLKANPLYETDHMAFMKTHYYGGIKKYQWTSIPLAMHGVLFTKDGKKVDIHIGEDPSDPVFYVNERLIHLSDDLMDKKAEKVVEGKNLHIIVGSNSRGQGEEKNPVKKNILKLLHEKYGIEERDFQVAEIELVPAGPAREAGFDRSLIVSHGHDDRVCAYAGLRAILETENPQRTAVGLFVDKEEVGSQGNTGMQSRVFEYQVAEMIQKVQGGFSDIDLMRTFRRSRVLSADVTVAKDPTSAEGVVDLQNTAYVGCGVTLAKYTGSGGKGGSNDANAEFLQEIRQIFDSEGVIWQTGELGEVDQGGGGTIAYILANYGAQVVDCGTGMLSMHSPMELVSKGDAYETFRAYKAFLK